MPYRDSPGTTTVQHYKPNDMKRLLICLALLCGIMLPTAEASAQEAGEFRLGLRAGYYTRAKAMGVGLYGNYGITDWLNIEPGVNVICKHDSSVDVYCDFQVPLEVTLYWHIFPIVGISVNDIASRSAHADSWSFGVNLGMGCSYDFSMRWNVTGQVKWMGQTAKNNKSPVIIQVGMGYNF